MITSLILIIGKSRLLLFFGNVTFAMNWNIFFLRFSRAKGLTTFLVWSWTTGSVLWHVTLTILILPEENVGSSVFLRKRQWSPSVFIRVCAISFLGTNVFCNNITLSHYTHIYVFNGSTFHLTIANQTIFMYILW